MIFAVKHTSVQFHESVSVNLEGVVHQLGYCEIASCLNVHQELLVTYVHVPIYLAVQCDVNVAVGGCVWNE